MNKEDQILKKLEQMDGQFVKIDQHFEKIEQKFDQIDKRFIKVDQRFDQIDQRFVKVDQRFDQMDQRFSKVDHQLEFLAEKTMNHDERLDRIEGTMATKEDIRSINETLEKQGVILERLDQERVAATYRMDCFETDLQTVKTKVGLA